MFNIGPGELIVIMILALVLLGPDKLPEVARAVGKGMRELRRATEDIRSTVEEELYHADLQRPAPPTPSTALGSLERLPPTSSPPPGGGSQTLPAVNQLAGAAPPASEPVGVHPAVPPSADKPTQS